MPVQKQELHRALTLLKEYHGQLLTVQDKPLQDAMDHVIFIFKGHLFQALLDVQEYYEMTLLNGIKSVQQEAFDTVLKLGTELPTEPHLFNSSFNNHSVASEEPLPLPSSLSDTAYQNFSKTKKAKFVTPPDIKKGESGDRWDYEDIALERGAAGLGFSIAGGTDVPHIGSDPSIYVTKVIAGGAALADGRLRINDIIMSVNGISTVNITHVQSVEALKNAGRSVEMVVKRLFLPSKQDIGQADLVKNSNAFTDQEITRKHLINLSTANDAIQSGAKVNDKITRDLRKVILRKGPTGFGFNIVGGEDGEGIFVSFIMSGGPADLSSQLHKGDQLISVNGIDIQEATHEQAAAALKGAGDVVEIALQYKPDEYRQFETKINDLREQMMIASTGSSVPIISIKSGFYVRALYDYNPLKDSGIPGRGLSFRFGDVLHVLNNLDEEEWWQAQKVFPEEDVIGYIPSKRSVEMNARSCFKSLADGKKKKMKKSKKADHGDEINVSKDGIQLILSYQSVTRKEAIYVRPLIVLGPLKDRIYDALISEFPDAFGSCIPHTTRPQKEHEVDGRDYHFVDSREEMERDIENHLFVEAGQYSDNLYGTSVQSVKDVAANGKHCILDIGVSAILRLQSVGLYPITVFIKPKSIESLMQWDIAQEDAQEIFNKTLLMEQEFGQHFTAIVSKETPDDIFREVNCIIEQHSVPFIWISNDIAE